MFDQCQLLDFQARLRELSAAIDDCTTQAGHTVVLSSAHMLPCVRLGSSEAPDDAQANSGCSCEVLQPVLLGVLIAQHGNLVHFGHRPAQKNAQTRENHSQPLYNDLLGWKKWGS